MADITELTRITQRQSQEIAELKRKDKANTRTVAAQAKQIKTLQNEVKALASHHPRNPMTGRVAPLPF